MNNIPIIIFGTLGVISTALIISDYRSKAKTNRSNQYELKVGYVIYLGALLQLFGFVILTTSAILAIKQNSGMEKILVPITILILVSLLISLLTIRNYKIVFDDYTITKINITNKKRTISYKDLNYVNYNLLGYGRNLILKDNQDNKIKIHNYLRGFQSLETHLEIKGLLKKNK